MTQHTSPCLQGIIYSRREDGQWANKKIESIGWWIQMSDWKHISAFTPSWDPKEWNKGTLKRHRYSWIMKRGEEVSDRTKGGNWKTDLRKVCPQWAEEKAENQLGLHPSPPKVQEVGVAGEAGIVCMCEENRRYIKRINKELVLQTLFSFSQRRATNLWLQTGALFPWEDFLPTWGWWTGHK